MGWPTLKRKHAARSVRFTTGAIWVEPDRRHVVLLDWGASAPDGIDPQAGQAAGSWHREDPVRDRDCNLRPVVLLLPGGRAGADRSTRARTPNGPRRRGRRRREAPRGAIHRRDGGESGPVKAALERLGKAQRRANRRVGPFDPATRKRRDPSNRWRRAQDRVARIQATVAAVREDSWHQLTTRLAQRYDLVVVEDLHDRRDEAQPQAGPRPVRRGTGHPAAASGLQDQLVRQCAARRRPVVSQLQDLLWLQDSETQAVPGRAHIHLRCGVACPWTGTSTPHETSPTWLGMSTGSCRATEKQDVEPT